MTFGQVIAHCFSNYVTFSGRARRSEFWYWNLFIFIGALCALTFDNLVLQNMDQTPIYSIFILATALPGIAVTTRRLHDVNRSGWWQLILFTGIGIFLLLYWELQPSQDEDNHYS